MTQVLALRTAPPADYVKVEAPLRLLLELEPGYRTFFRNFLDLILRRTEPPLFLASQPVHCTRHFYIRTGVRWRVILESFAWHMAVVPLLLIIWTLALKWESQRYPVYSTMADRSSEQLTYYAPDESFPAREGRQSEEVAPAAKSHPSALRVKRENQHSNAEPPNISVGGSVQPEIASSNPSLPAVPLSATARSQLVLPADLSRVIGPAPNSSQLALRKFVSQTASVVAPPPQVTGLSRRPGIAGTVAVVAPAPALESSLRTRRKGNIDIGSSAAVAPSPSLPMSGQRTGRGMGNGTLGDVSAAVVAPAPSMHGRIFLAGGSGNSLNGAGAQVVPPSPSVEHGLILASGRGNSLAGAGAQVVAPSPSIGEGEFRAGGRTGVRGGAGVRGNSFSGADVQVVPPSPSIGGSGNFGGGLGALSSAGLGGYAVPPAPSVGQLSTRGGTGAGTLGGAGGLAVGPAPSIASSEIGTGRGGGNSLTGFGSQVLPPSGGNGNHGSGVGGSNSASGAGSQGSASSGQGTGSSGEGTDSKSSSGVGTETVAGLARAPLSGAGQNGQRSAPIISTAIPPHAQVPDEPAGKTETLPLRVIQLAVALQKTSYFSNYEAFVAERSVNRETTQLIKLVYIFLPYQRRLTEFGVNTSKTFNLRVTRDPTCDESLLSMTWPEGEDHTKPATAESNKNKLPCYRTTADDYRKAWEKSR